MAERIRLTLTLEYGVDYKTDAGIESDVRDTLNQVGIGLHAMSRTDYTDGVATVIAEVYIPEDADEAEAAKEAQLVIDVFTQEFRKREEIAERNHPSNRKEEDDTESAPEESVGNEDGGESSSDGNAENEL